MIIDDVRYTQCPKKDLPEWVGFILQCYTMFDKGFLLENKSWFEHTQKYNHLMLFIKSEINRDQMEKMKHGRK